MPISGPQCTVVVPVYGRQDVTHALMADIAREPVTPRVIVVDNGGDYRAWGDELVLRQRENLGWLRGTNAGIRAALTDPCDFVCLLNNDTRLSPGFFDGLITAARHPKVGMVGPRYDDHWAHQHLDHHGPAATYQPAARERRVLFVDGTCMLLPRAVVENIGLLDEQTFGQTGWGGDIDLAIRIRQAGLRVVVTDRSYLRHDTGATAVQTHGDADTYWSRGDTDLRSGLALKWGPDWPWISGLSGRGVRARATHLLVRARTRRSV